MILLLDNDDSFTWNLVHLVAQVAPSRQVRVVRADASRAGDLVALRPSHVVISPGPRGPESAGASLDLIGLLAGRVPMMGVCLGMQCLAAYAGLRVGRAPRPVHGHTGEIVHDGLGLFARVPSPLRVMRYHSLAVLDTPGDGRWVISARSADGVPMGLRRVWTADEPHRAPLEGVQFHPESFLSQGGEQIMRNFLGL